MSAAAAALSRSCAQQPLSPATKAEPPTAAAETKDCVLVSSSRDFTFVRALETAGLTALSILRRAPLIVSSLRSIFIGCILNVIVTETA